MNNRLLIINQIEKVINDLLEYNQEINEETLLFGNVGGNTINASSLELIEIILKIEEIFNIEIDEKDICIGKVVDKIEEENE